MKFDLSNALDYPSSPKKDAIVKIVGAAIQAADPKTAVVRSVNYCGTQLKIGQEVIEIKGSGRILIAAVGKASISMTNGLLDVMKDGVNDGVVISKYLDDILHTERPLKVIRAGHPVPDENSVSGATHIRTMLRNLNKDDLLICLLSGGASSLLVDPIDGLTLQALRETFRQLLNCGASIEEINVIRKHLDGLKGGGLARLAAPAKVISLIISDVVGSPIEVIGSGLTATDPSTFFEANEILRKYQLLETVPIKVLDTLKKGMNGQIPETLKKTEVPLGNIHNFIIAENRQSAMASRIAAEKIGFNTLVLSTFIQGEARVIGKNLAQVLKEIAVSGNPVARPACVIAGGETTVKVEGKGMGGRNMEVALGAVEELRGIDDVCLISMASDGDDGVTKKAGAIITGETYQKNQELGLNINQFLADNDSHHFFEQTGGFISTGPTGTNVNDLYFMFAF